MEKESILIAVSSYFDPITDAVNNTDKAAELILNLGTRSSIKPRCIYQSLSSF
jgi:hypothetical protein